MPGITNPAEEYFKDGLWAWAATLWEKLISSGGRLFTALHGWDGTAWRKLPLVFGFSEPWAESLYVLMPADGPYSEDSSSVPAGEIWVLQAVTFLNYTGARGAAKIWLRGESNYLALGYHATPTQHEPVSWFGELVMSQGDFIRIAQATCLEDDALFAEVRGYKMKIAE